MLQRVVILGALALLSVSSAAAEVYVGLHLGLVDYFESGIDTSSVAGIQIAGGQRASHMGGEFAYWRSSTDGEIEVNGEGVDTELTVSEIAFGLGYHDGLDGKRPWYVGGGVTVMKAESNADADVPEAVADKAEIDGTTLGAYATGSIRWRHGRYASIGLAGRLLLFTDVGGVDLNTLQATVFVAFGK